MLKDQPIFLVDRTVRGRVYPNLAQHPAEPYTSSWREFDQHWPNTVPVRLFEHASTHGIELNIQTEYDASYTSVYYPIGIGFFQFNLDYIELLPEKIKSLLQQNRIRLLFYYHEGDNPHGICRRIEQLLHAHGYNSDLYRLITANTAVLAEKNGIFIADHELQYWALNRGVLTQPPALSGRKYAFTVLSRTHKWWRATIMADLYRNGVLHNSQWSYTSSIDCGDQAEDNPIAIDTIDGLNGCLDRFLTDCQPHTCDSLTHWEHNDHHLHVGTHYSDSYCSIILETLFDADQSGGAFLSEKTFKCLKHGHAFVIAGCAGSLATLRDLGYRTFDHAIDNTYDTVQDNTQRWLALRASILDLKDRLGPGWLASIQEDIVHNQQLFLASKQHRVNSILKQLYYT